MRSVLETAGDQASRAPAAGAGVLLVEDDAEISRLVASFLQREGFTVRVAVDGKAMDQLLIQEQPDLIILDLMLPSEDGLSICRRLRASSNVPIMILTAKGDEIDRVVGLEVGADDYLAKPFGPRELLARIRALLRRAHTVHAGATAPVAPANRCFAFDRFILDIDARRLSMQGSVVALTSGEFDMLACLVQRPRRVLTRDQILDWTHGRAAEPYDRTVDMLISRLRRKLAAACPGTEFIVTVRNGGYLFTAAVTQVRECSS